MNQEQFKALMPLICADLVRTIAEKQHISESEAIKVLYNSKLYIALEQEDTKVWHYSTPMLYSLLEREQETGTLLFPDV